MIITWCLVALLGTTSALPSVKEPEINTEVSLRNSALELAVLELLEEFRETMLNGSDDLPVLDPWQLEHVRADLGELLGLHNSYLELKNAALRHLSTFIVDDLSITLTSVILQRYSVEIDGRIPILEVEAENYDTNLQVVAGFNVFGNGKMKIRFIEPRIKGTVLLGLRVLPLGVNILSADVGFGLAGFESEITGMFAGDDFVNDFVNLFLGNLVPELVEAFEEDISKIISTIIVEVGNDILADLDLGSILGRDMALKIDKSLIKQDDFLR